MKPFLYPSVLELRVLEASFPQPLGRLARDFDPRRVIADLPQRPGVAEQVRAVLARFGRRPSHPLRPGGSRVRRAAVRGLLRSIDVAVDAGNEASLRTGLPVATIDADRLRGAVRVAELPHGTRMDTLQRPGADVGKLPAIVDADGPVATPVAIAGRAATTAETRRTLSCVWAPARCMMELDGAIWWLQRRLAPHDATCAERELPAPVEDPIGRALLDAILDEPDRDDTRLVFADWLETQGGAAARRRARLIRGGEEARQDRALAEAVAQDVGLDGAPVRWTRGFVSDLTINGDACDAGNVRRLRDEPVTRVSASGAHHVHVQVPATARDLSMWSPRLDAPAHPAPHRLRRVHLSGGFDAAGWAWLGSLSSLEWLAMEIACGAPWYLATSLQWPALETLRLQGGAFTPEAAAAMPLEHLTELELQWCRLDDETLARIPRPLALRSLALAKGGITTLAPFEGAPLRSLSLCDVPLGAGDAARICAMTELETLHVSACPGLERPLIDAIDHGALPALRRIDGIRVQRLPAL